MIRLRDQIRSRFVLRALFGALLTSAAISCFPSAVGAQEIKAAPRERLQSMLAAINEIRERRDTTLDCTKYVYPHLGRHDRVQPYIDLFAANGIMPEVGKYGQTYYTAFTIDYSQLRNVPKSKFGARDIVVIRFATDGNDSNSVIQTCFAVLRAAPQHL
jgi:hypothetical protein